MAGMSAKGQRPENQDVILIIDSLGGDFSRSVVGVLDGHGKWGKHAADMGRDVLAEILTSPEYLAKMLDDPEAGLKEAFVQTHLRLCEADDKSRNVRYSGATATLCYFTEESMVVANVGDSDMVLGSLAEISAPGVCEKHISAVVTGSHRAEVRHSASPPFKTAE